ncbi:MAG: hypothetical protein Q4B32_00675 [Clostridia bacterium]|nr:hypothetical protein [Clostridia bacterium]
MISKLLDISGSFFRTRKTERTHFHKTCGKLVETVGNFTVRSPSKAENAIKPVENSFAGQLVMEKPVKMISNALKRKWKTCG